MNFIANFLCPIEEVQKAVDKNAEVSSSVERKLENKTGTFDNKEKPLKNK